MSSVRDWRNSTPYDLAETLPVSGLAWEFLRRDDDYDGAYRGAVKQSVEAADRAAGRWGLRFRPGSSPGRYRGGGALAPAPRSACRTLDGRSDRVGVTWPLPRADAA
jgi:hypothetical protein